MNPPESTPAAFHFNCLSGGGEMGDLMRSIDWSKTPIGAVECWSPTLQTMVSFMLANRFQMLLWWGRGFCQLYNDAFLPCLGKKHPISMGQPASECWAEIWHIIGPLIETPFRGGEATWMEDIFLEIRRHGFAEETHWTIAYSPVTDETVPNGIGGVAATVHEITEKVVGERRIVLLRDLGARSAEAKTAEEACAIAAETLGRHPEDIPFAALYLLDHLRKQAYLAGTAGMTQGKAESPTTADLTKPGSNGTLWPFSEALRSETIQLIDDLQSKLPNVPLGPWSDPPRSAVVLPIPSNIAHQLAGFLVLGISSRLRFDNAYRGFFELVTSQVATTIANARAYEHERKRSEALLEIDRAKTVFFSNVSHEFRTPLTLMLGPLQEMVASARDPVTVQREELQLVHRNCLRLLKLVNALLDFSRIEAGRLKGSYEATDLAAYTLELASVFRSAIEKAGLRLSVDCPALEEPVYVDRAMWEKIVLNLLSNAFKFTFEGEIAVSLRKAGESVELSVGDTGIGIAEHELPRLFERFRRVEGARGRTYEGSGIGLALVQELAKLHGGTVCAESIYGQGSRFVVKVPLGRAHLPAEHSGGPKQSFTVGGSGYVEEALHWLPSSQPPAAATVELIREITAEPETSWPTPGCAQSRGRILLADDNAEMRLYVRRLLISVYEVEDVGDGQAALAAAVRNPPDLILSDIMMPRMDGFALLRALRADPSTRSIPVVLLSARAGEEAQVEGLEAGADDYLVKPFSADALRARIRNLVATKRTRDLLQKELSTRKENLSELTRELIASRRTLQRSEAYLAEGQRISHTGTCAWNPSTGELLWSKEHCRIFGVHPDETRQSYQAFLEKIHAEDRALVQRTVDQAVQQRTRFDIEYRIIDAGGSIKYIHSLGQPANEDFSEYIGTVMDVTDRKRADEELRRSEAYLAKSESLSHTGSWAWNVSMGELFWSEEHFRVLGLVPNGRRPSLSEALQVIHPDDRFNVQQALEKALHDRAHFQADCRVVRPDGSIRYIHSRADPVFNESGELIEYAGTIIDNTERKQSEQALQKAQTDLAHMARVTTMGEFAVSIAHEVNQPLSALVNDAGACLAWLDREQPSIVEASAAATRIMEQGIRASEVISKIRSLMKRSPPQVTLVHINEIVNEVLSLTNYEVLTRGVALKTDLADDVLAVRGDSVQLKQVLANLVVNAIEAVRQSKEGLRELLITSRNSGPGEILVSVRDSGVGINPGAVEELFKPFVTHKPEGMGMGLAISRSIIEVHGGRLWATANDDAGATFQFCLPARDAV